MVVEDETVALIDVFLSDAVLEQIFCYLTPIELVILERVSKRWQEISLRSWRNKKKLIADIDLGFKFPLKHIDKILQRGGKYLTHLDISISTVFPPVRREGDEFPWFQEREYPEKLVFKAISKYCQQLEFLNLLIDEGRGSLPCGKNMCFLEGSVFQDLKTLFIKCNKREVTDAFEDRLSGWLRKAQKLEDFSIEIESGIYGSCLLNLPKTCKKLAVYCFSLNDEIFMKVLENLKNLKSLDTGGVRHLKPNVVSQVWPKLDTFVLGWNEKFFAANRYRTLSFENLRALDITESQHVNDAVLGNLVVKMPLLEKFTMKWSENISDKGFRSLARLIRLKYLDISKSGPMLSDETITHIAESLTNLEKVLIEDCDGITCSGLLNLINSCKRLQYLITGKFDFTDEFLKSALHSVEQRPRNSSLTIDIGSSVPKNSEFLKPRNDRQLKYNYCKIQGCDFVDEEKWAVRVPIIRYVSGSSISEEFDKMLLV